MQLQDSKAIFSNLNTELHSIDGDFLNYRGQRYYRITNYDKMDPFFMTITSSSNHWMFISSTGGLTAGRINSDNAIFPYYTVDKITENSENTGSKTIVRIQSDSKTVIWMPFSDHYKGIYQLERFILKNIPGSSVIFQEINHNLELMFELEWTTSQEHGIIKRSSIKNLSNNNCSISIIDGVINTLPAMVNTQIQTQLSNLLDAYKRNELDQGTKLGIFTLSATLTDLAEPSESLGATTWWQKGLKDTKVLLCDSQLGGFIQNGAINEEEDIKGKRGAYLVQSDLFLEASEKREWLFCGEVNQSHSLIHNLIHKLKEGNENFLNLVQSGIKQEADNLERIIGLNDGLQKTGNELSSAHHSVNVLFNLMRGGYFVHGQLISSDNLQEFIKKSNINVYKQYAKRPIFEGKEIRASVLYDKILDHPDHDLRRLVREYLPLVFSRRHGDPSRPWNHFSIRPNNEDGSPRIDFQGNWRDIFQNWEALLLSNPVFIFPVITKFLNATTVDGYNPYRISMNGIDWELPEEDNPWSNIGYWSDHQIIYLEKLLELHNNYLPGDIKRQLMEMDFVFANLPYEIKKYESIKTDPKNTIYFNPDKNLAIKNLCSTIGADGCLLHNKEGEIIHTNLVEKLIILLCAKVSNFIPDGGIWMNTQRPEWNDANNALVGNGISVVTLSYLIRFIKHLTTLFIDLDEEITFHYEIRLWFSDLQATLDKYRNLIDYGFSREKRLTFMNDLGESGSKYRINIYKNGFSGRKSSISKKDLIGFLNLTNIYFKTTLSNNTRADGLFHSYNRLELNEDGAEINNLYEMLEGQVAALSSGAVNSQKALATLSALRASSMYRNDQNSYMLYPNRNPGKFLEKNTIVETVFTNYPLAVLSLKLENNPVFERNFKGDYHFKWTFRNAESVKNAIHTYNTTENYEILTKEAEKQILDLFEKCFNHKGFTGRSGTFFAYEGLGSIYWHMVSKLLLATQEKVMEAFDTGETEITQELRQFYFEIRKGIGFNKTPDVYGAFPIDPYSHTPDGSGAKQPGMTGQVKEEIITRLAEMGITIKKGKIFFTQALVDESEFLKETADWYFFDINGKKQHIHLLKDSFGFTFCQIPIIIKRGNPLIVIQWSNGEKQTLESSNLGIKASRHIFFKDGRIKQLNVSIPDIMRPVNENCTE